MRLNTRTHLLLLLLLLMTLVLGLTSVPHESLADDPKDILIVANKSVGVDSLTLGEAKNLFLHKRTQWADGAKALPIYAPQRAPIRAEFDDKVLSMSLEDELVYWYKKKIQKGTPSPPEFSNPQKAVFRLKGSVGYIYRSKYREGVSKILLVIPAK